MIQVLTLLAEAAHGESQGIGAIGIDPKAILAQGVTFLLFFFTGIAVVLYLNQPGNQPRERDYAYVGSFYAFAIWIGLGVMAIYDFLQKKMNQVLHHSSDRVKLGSLVITNKARFYLSVSLGEFFYEGDRFYAISEESPMAKIMLGKTEGEEFVLNRIHQKIEKII